jgi:hypothetical protein
MKSADKEPMGGGAARRPWFMLQLFGELCPQTR